MNDGSGFSMLTPARPTKAYLVNNDPEFARQVLSHNAMCEKMSGCQK